MAAFKLWLTKTSAGGGQIGEQISYTIVIGNDGPGTAIGPITVTDVVLEVSPVTGATGENWNCSILEQTVECVLDGDLAAGAEATIVISTVVSRSASGTVANSADVESDGPVTEPDITDNTDVDTVSIGELPRTGSDLLRFTIFGLLLLLAGAALVMGSRQVWSECS